MKIRKVYVSIILFGLLLSCGNSANGPLPSTDNVEPYIRMNPPIIWIEDNSQLFPERDLKYWKIYALNLDNNGSSWFTDENEVANVEVINNYEILRDFNLNLLNLPKGEYLIGLKVEAINGRKSDFADNTVLWENK